MTKVTWDLSNFPTDVEIRRMWNAVPKLERYRVGDRVTRAAGKVIHARARQLAPRSRDNPKVREFGPRSKRQAKSANWKYPLWKAIVLVVRKYEKGGAIAIIGPSYPRGNKVYFFTAPGGKRIFLPRRDGTAVDTGRMMPARRNFLRQAAEETAAQQTSAVGSELAKVTREMWEVA